MTIAQALKEVGARVCVDETPPHRASLISTQEDFTDGLDNHRNNNEINELRPRLQFKILSFEDGFDVKRYHHRVYHQESDGNDQLFQGFCVNQISPADKTANHFNRNHINGIVLDKS